VPGCTVETIFVDGMSTDRTPAMLVEYARTRPNVTVLENRDKIVPHAMNLGIRAAAGELIVRIDAHAEYAPDYVAKCIEYSQKIGAENVGGPMRAKGVGFVGNAVELAHHCPFGLGGGRFHDKDFDGFVDTVYLGAFSRMIFNVVGFYDERLVRNQDIELNARIRKVGGHIYLTPEIRSSYKCRSTLGGLWGQNFMNGAWAVYTRAIAPYALSLRHFVPLVFVAALLVGLIVAAMPSLQMPVRFLPLAATLGSYLTASFFFSMVMAIRGGGRYFFMLPIVFATLHLSYGAGSLWGIVTLRAWLKAQIPACRGEAGNCHDKG
jgi:GT2 family glycosyltransferase